MFKLIVVKLLSPMSTKKKIYLIYRIEEVNKVIR